MNAYPLTHIVVNISAESALVMPVRPHFQCQFVARFSNRLRLINNLALVAFAIVVGVRDPEEHEQAAAIHKVTGQRHLTWPVNPAKTSVVYHPRIEQSDNGGARIYALGKRLREGHSYARSDVGSERLAEILVVDQNACNGAVAPNDRRSNSTYICPLRIVRTNPRYFVRLGRLSETGNNQNDTCKREHACDKRKPPLQFSRASAAVSYDRIRCVAPYLGRLSAEIHGCLARGRGRGRGKENEYAGEKGCGSRIDHSTCFDRQAWRFQETRQL